MWTKDRYKQFLRTFGLTQADYAALLGHSARTGQYWATSALAPSAETMARLIEARPELLDVLRQVASARDKAAAGEGSAEGGAEPSPRNEAEPQHKQRTIKP